jgi:hypothetical protein
MKFLYLVCGMTVLWLTSCSFFGKDCAETLKCQLSTHFLFSLHGFSQDEADTIIVRRYKPSGSGFESMEDSVIYSFANKRIEIRDSVDGRAVYKFSPLTEPKPDGYRNMEVVVPGGGRTYRVIDVTDDGNRTQTVTNMCGTDAIPTCFLEIVSMRVDGVLFTKVAGEATDIAFKK